MTGDYEMANRLFVADFERGVLKPQGARFCKHGPSYQQLADFAADQRDMHNPASIALWRAVSPERHDAYLRWAWRRYPQWRAAIEASRELVR